MPSQYDLFGGCEEIKELIRKPTNKYRSMQEQYGYKENETCKTCSHCLKCDYHNKIFYKCELWILSHSSATDIRLKNKACGKWEG